MKILKIIAPILLALTILFCILFGFLSILREPIVKWHNENQEQAYYDWLEDIFGTYYGSNNNAEENNYYISSNMQAFEVESDVTTVKPYTPSTDAPLEFQVESSNPIQMKPSNDETITFNPENIIVITPSDDVNIISPKYTYSYSTTANALNFGSFPLLSLLFGDNIKPGSFIASLFIIITDCLVPSSIIFISVIILALYFVLLKTKTSIYVSGALGRIAKIFSIIAVSVGILASLGVCLFSLAPALECTVSLVKSLFDEHNAAYWSGIILALVDFLLSLAGIAVFFLIAICLIIFLVITIKSKQATKVQNKKSLVALCLISAVGTVVSSFVTLHFAMSTIFSITAYTIDLVRFGFTMREIISFVVQLSTALGLLILASSIAVGFIITLLKAIISLKRSRKKELYAYNSEELSLFDVPEEESTEGAEPSEDASTEENEIIESPVEESL